MSDIFKHTLFFVRHGETDWNVEGRLQGHVDTCLNARGRQQAAQAARTLAKMGQSAMRLNYLASPLRRCVETMAILRETLGLPPEGGATDPRLKEISFGIWQGKTWPQVEADHPDLILARKSNVWSFAPPEGESYAALAARVSAALSEAQAREPGDLVMVSHGGVGRALMAVLGGMSQARALTTPMTQGRVMVFQHGRCQWL